MAPTASPDRLELLRQAVDEHGQAEVARRIGKSPSAVNQILHGTYQARPDEILERVAEEYGAEVVACPVLGEIALGRCAENRRKPFSAANPVSVRLYRVCKSCERNRGGER